MIVKNNIFFLTKFINYPSTNIYNIMDYPSTTTSIIMGLMLFMIPVASLLNYVRVDGFYYLDTYGRRRQRNVHRKIIGQIQWNNPNNRNKHIYWSRYPRRLRLTVGEELYIARALKYKLAYYTGDAGQTKIYSFRTRDIVRPSLILAGNLMFAAR